MKDKTIFHNYGHGSSGITVAPATALEVAELVDRENVKNERVAVMGSGIAGITSAL